MATVFTKMIQPDNGNWIVTVEVTSKDVSDIMLAQKYGDITLELGGTYTDPDDPTFSFNIPIDANKSKYSNILLNKLPNAAFIYSFDDAGVIALTKYRQATIFMDGLQSKLTAALTALRAMTVTTPVNTTFSV